MADVEILCTCGKIVVLPVGMVGAVESYTTDLARDLGIEDPPLAFDILCDACGATVPNPVEAPNG